MKYFIDTEFHEHSKKPLIGKPIDTIELISIGIISEEYKVPRKNMEQQSINYTQKEYYAICKEFDLKAAWNNEWLRDNVILEIMVDLYKKDKNKEITLLQATFKEFKRLINKYGKTKKQIADEIVVFVSSLVTKDGICFIPNDTEFYAYYADYDWVVFCWLFGRMIDLPTGFPMYCIDLKQILDEKAKTIPYSYDKDLGIKSIEMSKTYPKQINEHNALADAKWNYELYKFLNTLQ